MVIQVELFGILRQRAGTATVRIELPGEQTVLANVYQELGRRFPDLAAACLEGSRLRPEYIVNIGGERFVSDPGAVLRAGDALLMMSADAGG
jgi:molybdopterin converting factor small subunit